MAIAFTSKPQTKKATPVKRRAKPTPVPKQPIFERTLGFGFHFPQGAIAPRIQPKLKIGEPNDKYEKEADRVADSVVQISDREIHTSTLPARIPLSSIPSHASFQIQRLCTECREEEMLQTKKAKGNDAATSSSLVSSSGWIPSHGESLPQSIRSFFEPRFGLSFHQVRIHKGYPADQLARSVNARAFTLGNDIVFGSGEYQPQTHHGRKLLAHELTHVVQQNSVIKQTAQLIQRDAPSLPSLPEPDVDCSIDFAALARILAGDRAAARQVIDCCVNVPRLGRGCSSQVIRAACNLIPSLCRGGGGSRERVRCPLGFRPAQSEAFRGKCCREGTVIESERDCCLPHQITVNGLFPRCCPPQQMPDGAKRECINLPDIPLPDFPRPQPVPPVPVGPQPLPTLSPATIFFFFDSTIRRPESNNTFEMVLSTLRTISRLRVQLIGHTSLEGTPAYNLQLAQRRADGIRSELVIAGIDSSRITTFSLGEATPAVPEPNIEGRSLSPRVEDIRDQNRRVEVVFIDPEGEFAPSFPPVTLRQPELRLPTPGLSPSLGTPQLRFR